MEKSKKKFTSKKENCFRIDTSEIRTHIHKIIVSWGTANVWEGVELRIDPDSFCTSCQISSMNKKARSKIPLKPKAPFTWDFMDIVPTTSTKSLTRTQLFLTTI